ncbi:MAG TPA: ABC transporter permease [Gemmatimonadales bacterium]|nr:ABC transporter permease [Gemmatimonadales bacterium]
MRPSRLLRVAAQSMLRNKLRTLLTMLGIVIGVAAVILMVAVGYGAQSRIQEQVASLGTNLIVITPGSTTRGGVSLGAGTFNRLTVEDADKLIREGTVLSGVSPVTFTRAQIVGGAGNWRAPINGVSTAYQTIRDWPVEAGTFFSDDDVRSMRKVAIVGKTVADNLFPGIDAVGQQVRLRNVPFTIVGVLAAKGQTAGGADQDDVVLVPYTTAQTRLSGVSFIGQILVSAALATDIPAAQQEIRAILRESHRLSEDENDDFTVRNQSDLAEAAQSTTEVMSLLLAAIASISLVVGGIGIMNIMLVSVTERTREIGIRLAVGARGSDVLTQFLVESVAMSLLGGLFGLAMGFGGAVLLGRLTGWSTATPPAAVLIAVGFSAAVGVFFGWYPARKAARLDPIEALRHD